MAAGGLGCKEGGAVIVELPPRVPVAPGLRLIENFVTILLLDELRARRNWIFNQKILRRRAVDRNVHCQRVPNVDGTLEWIELVDNLSIPGGGAQLEVIAGQVEREGALLVELLLGGIVLPLHRPIGAPGSVLADCNHIAAGVKLGGGNIDRKVGAGDGVRRCEMALGD